MAELLNCRYGIKYVAGIEWYERSVCSVPVPLTLAPTEMTSRVSCAARGPDGSAGGRQLAGPPHHLLHFGDVLLLQLDLVSGVLLQPHALIAHRVQQLVVCAQRRAFMIERLVQDLTDVMLGRFDQLGPPSDVTSSPAIDAWFMPRPPGCASSR